jgi:hypothetical protein
VAELAGPVVGGLAPVTELAAPVVEGPGPAVESLAAVTVPLVNRLGPAGRGGAVVRSLGPPAGAAQDGVAMAPPAPADTNRPAASSPQARPWVAACRAPVCGAPSLLWAGLSPPAPGGAVPGRTPGATGPPSPVGSASATGSASRASPVIAVLSSGVHGLQLAPGGVVRERESRLSSLVRPPVRLPG